MMAEKEKKEKEEKESKTADPRILPTTIEQEMKASYIDYAMSVIVGRALPDVRDGLKPVHRRILYAMDELGLQPGKPYKKSARIVGETLGKYHPHGDMAVYDAMVRMGQDFSLRYLLVDGQGNMGCFTGDTKIRLADGRSLSFIELIEENEHGKKNYTYTFNPESGKTEMAEIKNPRLTKKAARIVKIILDNGEEIKCTPNHLFMTRDGSYKEAQELMPGQDSLMPLYFKLSTKKEDPNMADYEMVYQPLGDSWEYSHCLADEWNINNGVYPKGAGRIRHHKDFNKENNSPGNIVRMNWGKHWKAHIERLSKRNKENWQKVEYRAKRIEAIKKFRFLRVCDNVLWESGILNEGSYEKARREYGSRRGEGIIEMRQLFNVACDRLRTGLNHKIVKVEFLKERAEVYDLTIEKSHNFALASGVFVHNSVDGDPPAAMRYTEARLSPLAVEMLADIEKETVNFGPNFDESLQEPLVLPSKIPNLLINGSSGIAVGMATNIPPHNLSEVVDALGLLIDAPEAPLEEISKIVKGPDFPTGGLICGKQGIKDAYTTGRGLLALRARFDVERVKAGKEAIIVTEIPYLANKAELIEQIAEQVKEKKITGISDLRDESDREGMRIYIELKRDASRDVVLNQLFKHSNLQTTFGVNLVALVGGEPKLLTLREMMAQYLKHREEVVTRRTKYELRKAEEQAHILEGLVICVSNIDAVVNLIKKSKNPDEAREGLMKKFDLSKIQAQAILDLKLQRLTQLERLKIEEELKALKKLIGELKGILASRKKLLGMVKKELAELKEKYGDKRRTDITAPAEEIEIEQLIPEMEVAVLITRDGYVKRVPVSSFKAQLRGGRGVAGMTTREEDEIENIFTASTHAFVLFFTNRGRVYKLKVYDLPEASRAGKGQAIPNVLQVEQGETVTAAVPVESFEKKTFLVMSTRNGMVKKVPLEAFANIRRSGIIAIKLKDQDELRWVQETDGKREIILGAESGLMIRFSEKEVRPMGRAAAGVRGIRLGKKDVVVSMDIIRDGGDLLVISQGGFGKRMKLDEFSAQRRGGKGHIAIKLRDKDKVSCMKIIQRSDELLFVSARGTMSRQKASGVSTQGRYAKGVRIQRVDEGDYIVDMARVISEEEAAEALKIAVEEEEKRKEELRQKIKEERAKLPSKRRRRKSWLP